MNIESRQNRKPRITKWLSILNLILLVATYLIVNFSCERFWLAVAITRVPHVLGLVGLIMLAWTAIRKDRRLAALNALALAFWIIALMGFNVPLGAFGRASGHDIRLMTYNVRQGQFGHDRLARVIREQNPDVLCVQEVYAMDKYGDPVKFLSKNLPGRWYIARVGEVAMFSRYPILSKKVYRLPQKTERDILEVTLKVKGQKLIVLNTHLNVRSAEWERLHTGKSLIADLDQMSFVLSEQMIMLVEKADQADGLTLIVGDFNLTPLGPTYRRIASKYQDAFRAAGWGFGFTSNPRKPFFRIDYIFADKNIRVNKCYVPPGVASDHRAVVADFALPR
ncbi:MAG: endonuclease/exonuclease/phosphatase family protein [Armatimonadetes bacterium]|nr:endonuclease/exonuclease/phosphatase family protein [Armatimonadota bacterium]